MLYDELLPTSPTESDRCCRKSPKLICGQFPAERRNTRRLPVDMPSGELPKSPASSSLDDASPHTIAGWPHLRLRKFAFSDAKRLFRQHRSNSEVGPLERHVRSIPNSRRCRTTPAYPGCLGDIEWLTSRPSTMSAASHPSDTAPRSSALRSARNSVQCPSRMRGSSASEPVDCRGRNLLATECNS